MLQEKWDSVLPLYERQFEKKVLLIGGTNCLVNGYVWPCYLCAVC